MSVVLECYALRAFLALKLLLRSHGAGLTQFPGTSLRQVLYTVEETQYKTHSIPSYRRWAYVTPVHSLTSP